MTSRIITDEVKAKIISLSQQGFNNWQIAMECQIKYATLCYWKKKLKLQGIAMSVQIGRPKATDNHRIKLPGQIAELRRQEKEDQVKAQTNKPKPFTKSSLDAMTPENKAFTLLIENLNYDELEP